MTVTAVDSFGNYSKTNLEGEIDYVQPLIDEKSPDSNDTMPTPLRGKTEAGDARPFTFQLYRYSAFDNRGSRLAKRLYR